LFGGKESILIRIPSVELPFTTSKFVSYEPSVDAVSTFSSKALLIGRGKRVVVGGERKASWWLSVSSGVLLCCVL
jgi:hypothetical protein